MLRSFALRSSIVVVLASSVGACSASSDSAAFGGGAGGSSGGAHDGGAGDASQGDSGGAGGQGGGAGAAGFGGSAGAGGTGGAGGAGGFSGAGGGTGGSGGSVCPQGTFTCNGNVQEICDGQGGYQFIDCGSNVCDPLLGCVLCHPGTATCNGNTSQSCLSDGSGFTTVTCDSDIGVTCDPNSGACVGDCAPNVLGTSYIGCEYYPTVLGNEVNISFDYAVAISNTSAKQADVKITGGALSAPVTLSVPPGGVQVQTLPWVPLLKACYANGLIECGGTTQPAALVSKGAYHLKSTEPITVYQFNALQYEKGGAYSYTNDASLLLPVNALTSSYLVAAWPRWNNMPGLLAVTATSDGTVVTITPKSSTNAGNGAPAFPKGSPTQVTMQAGDVLELLDYAGDLTGSSITATQPIVAFGGHFCTQVPIGTTACDHLEESMFPIETLSTSYVVTAPAVPALPKGKVEVIRIVATAPNTTLTYDPPQPGAPTSIAAPGDFVEIAGNANDFQINASEKILVSQYMEGQDAGGGSGDPAMTLAVASAQYRTSYLFHAPTSYSTNYVNVVAPTGSTIQLDGNLLTGFAPIGSTGFGVSRVTLSNAGNGNHTITGTAPFGITVYGYGQYTSYWYPGGLNLQKL